MIHADDIAWQLRSSAKLKELGTGVTDLTDVKRWEDERAVFVAFARDGRVFRVTIEKVHATDLTDDELFAPRFGEVER